MSSSEPSRPPGSRSRVTWRSMCATARASSSRPAKTTSSQRLMPIPGLSQRRRFTPAPARGGRRRPARTRARAARPPAPRRSRSSGGSRPCSRWRSSGASCPRRCTPGPRSRGSRAGTTGTGCATGWPRTNSRTASVRPDSCRRSVDVVRVLHEPDVEDEVGLERDAVLEAEADELDRQLVRAGGRRRAGRRAARGARAATGREVSIDDVGLGADRVEDAGAPRRSSWRSRAGRRAGGGGASR